MRAPIHNVPTLQRGYPGPQRPSLSPQPFNRPPPSGPVFLQPPGVRPIPTSTPNFYGPSTPTFNGPPPPQFYSPAAQTYNRPPQMYNRPPIGVGYPMGGYPAPGVRPGMFYPFQQIPGMGRHPQQDLNMNFDYEQANFLTDTKIVENSVFCVICGQTFKGSERDEHLKLHMRRPSGHSKIEGVSSALQQKTQGLKKGFVVKPIIEPEEHIVSYEPIVYEMVEEIIYEDPSMIATKEMAIGNDQSFSMLDPNMSVDYGRNTDIPSRKIQTEANPFTSRGSGYDPNTYGNNYLYEGNSAYKKDPNNSLSYSGASRMQVQRPQEKLIKGDPHAPSPMGDNLNGSSLQIRESVLNQSLLSNHSKK